MGTRRGSGRTETAVDESRKETADRVARYRTNYVGRTYISMLLVPQTAAAASKVFLLSFGFPVPSVRSWSYSQNRRVSAYYIYDQPDPRVAQSVFEEAGRAEQHIITEAVPNELKFGGA